MRRFAGVLVGAVAAVAVLAGDAVADPPGWGLQPLPGWTCTAPPENPFDRTCTARGEAGDVAAECRQWDRDGGGVDEGTSCAVSQAGAEVARCGEDVSGFGSGLGGLTTTTRSCSVGGERVAGCAQESWYDTGGGGDSAVCDATVGDLAVSCEAAQSTTTISDTGQSVVVRCDLGGTVCELRVDGVATSPVPGMRCPAAARR